METDSIIDELVILISQELDVTCKTINLMVLIVRETTELLSDVAGCCRLFNCVGGHYVRMKQAMGSMNILSLEVTRLVTIRGGF